MPWWKISVRTVALYFKLRASDAFPQSCDFILYFLSGFRTQSGWYASHLVHMYFGVLWPIQLVESHVENYICVEVASILMLRSLQHRSLVFTYLFVCFALFLEGEASAVSQSHSSWGALPVSAHIRFR